MNSNLPQPDWMSMTKGGKRTSEYTDKPKKKKPTQGKPTKGNVTDGGMIKSGKRKPYLDSL